ncbi:hypothetical protein N0V93_005762 [Gnomoniopsis smithogilvyi]|uniref:Uncharacterized protein n=1 Tax=Gnomoniopsis smithogilvyi TaxID=1191159 RepID=A0A9W8YTX1_9PEZI|nr:hypothetical protein N0V93_005762 [Gnomoniopsis smithogilvyi]
MEPLKKGLQRTTCCLATVALFVFVASILLLSLPNKQIENVLPPEVGEFGIGFDLSPSYATVAVSYPNGSVQPIARVEGDQAYRELMIRLSQPSSQHLHKPYQNVGEAISDTARRTIREARKRISLPSSRDVGVLSNMVQALRGQALNAVGEPIRAATISTPHLAALYGEDLIDAFSYIGIVYLEFFPFNNFRPIHASIAAYAGNGLGFCADYRNVTACEEEEEQIRAFFALTIGYTHCSLTVSQARLGNAYYIREEITLEDLTLGYGARQGHPGGEDAYWEAVRNVLRYPVVTSAIQRDFSKVLVYGDAADIPKFREVLEEALGEVLEGSPEIVDRQPEMCAAMGVAEMAKRAIFRQRQELDTNPEL